MEKKKIDKDTEVKELTSKWETLSRDSAIISAAIQYKKSKEIISKKLDNEKVAINYGINSVNKKVLENLKKYNEIENELKQIMEHYEKNLLELSSYYDCSIVINYAKRADTNRQRRIGQERLSEGFFEYLTSEATPGNFQFFGALPVALA